MRYAYYAAPDYTAFPITTSAAKVQLRIDPTDTTHDTLIASHVETANAWMAKTLGMALAAQTVDVYLDHFPDSDSPIILPFPPLTSVTHVKYTDSAGAQSTITAATDYTVDTISSPGRIVLNYGYSWPSVVLATSNPIVIRQVCGYTTTASVPSPIRRVILWVVNHLFNNPDPVLVAATTTVATHLPMGLKALLEEYSVKDYGTLWSQ